MALHCLRATLPKPWWIYPNAPRAGCPPHATGPLAQQHARTSGGSKLLRKGPAAHAPARGWWDNQIKSIGHSQRNRTEAVPTTERNMTEPGGTCVGNMTLAPLAVSHAQSNAVLMGAPITQSLSRTLSPAFLSVSPRLSAFLEATGYRSESAGRHDASRCLPHRSVQHTRMHANFCIAASTQRGSPGQHGGHSDHRLHADWEM